MRALIPAMAALSLLVASCASGAPSDEDAVRRTTREWLLAVYASDGERACELLAPERAEEVARAAREAALAASPDLPAERLPTCETVYAAQAEAVAEPLSGAGVSRERLETEDGVFAIALDGDRATVTVAGGVRSVELRRTGDGWRVVSSAAG
jgi:hypothetical protein